jgi:hypothetical protein
MPIIDLAKDLREIFRPQAPSPANPVQKTPARCLADNTSVIFQPASPRRPPNLSVTAPDVVDRTLEACADIEQRVREMDPEPKEIGYRDGYIYGFSNPHFPGCLKIGRSVEPTDRARSWQTGQAYGSYHEEFRVWVTGYGAAEREVHRLLADCRIEPNREWFWVSLMDALSAVMTAAEVY